MNTVLAAVVWVIETMTITILTTFREAGFGLFESGHPKPGQQNRLGPDAPGVTCLFDSLYRMCMPCVIRSSVHRG